MVFISEEEFSAHDIHQALELVPSIWFFSWCFNKTTQEGPNNISVSFLFLLKWTFQKHPLSWVCKGQCCLIISGKFNIYCINVCACFSWFWLISNSNLTSSWLLQWFQQSFHLLKATWCSTEINAVWCVSLLPFFFRACLFSCIT